MSTLAFFPWLRLNQNIEVGEFEMIAFDRETYAGADAEAVASITSAYQQAPDVPVREATLLRVGQGNLLSDLDESQVSAAFLFGEMVALSGLAKRRFFDISGYSNRDHYRLIVQRFEKLDGGVGIGTRRRDGGTNNLLSRKLHRVPCPEHVHAGRVAVDKALLQALVKARMHAAADEIIDSMISFNLANTDASSMSPHVELVLSTGAFERVLGCRNGRDDDLAKGFTTILEPHRDISRADCSRVAQAKRFGKSTWIRDVWIRDLFALRGDLAHGKVGPEYPSIWTVREHLLLASYIFPLVMKLQLAAAKLYTLTRDDQFAIDAIEPLMCAEDLFRPIDEDRYQWPWNEIIANVPDDEGMARAGEILLQMMGLADADGTGGDS